jgi:cellulose synthase/poly-beta-1,6-N-acetylglucosamine synthase-like glycosyltransferase
MLDDILVYALVVLYFLFNALLLPYGYNCFLMVLAAQRYRNSPAKPVANHPIVTVQLPVYNEKYVVTRLIESVCAIDWPKDRLEILVLDDSSDDTVDIVDREVGFYRQRGFNIDVVRRPNRTGFKAGALQEALGHTHGKYIAILDADFVPPTNFLERTVAVLEADPGLGFVQARWGHINRGYSQYTEAFALGIDAYHVVEQSARSAMGLIFNFSGSAGVLRTDAVNEAGGWSSDTLSEDLDISYRIQLKGWRSLYLKDYVVLSEVPPTMSAFRMQQSRWARGSIQCAKKLIGKVWASPNLNLLQKVEGTLHLSYYTISLWMFLGLVVTVPLLALNKFPYVTNPIYLALFGLLTVSSFTLYYTALRMQKFEFGKKARFMALLGLIGYGLSAKCGIEMIKGLFVEGGSYERVPKYNITKNTDSTESKSYKVFQSVPSLEIFFMLYAALGLFFAAVNGSHGIMLYLLIYLLGYLTVALSLR